MDSKTAGPAWIEAVAIGRNEGDRLLACLASLRGQVRRVIYVDSGSTDGSVAAARAAGAEVVPLALDRPFTAARARNAGLAQVSGAASHVLFIDGDCSLDPGFLGAALAAFATHPAAVAVCGRRRERHPEASVWNRLADREWDTPVGQARACGGDVLFLAAPLRRAGGYRDELIAGEEPELCLRLIRAGGEIWRIDAEMTLHDAALLRFGQWWRRVRRSGHAYAEGAWLHGRGPERHWVRETRRAVLWGAVLPLLAIGAGLLHPAGWLLLLAYPAQVLRLWRREGDFASAFFQVLGRFAEAQGAIGFWLDRLRNRRRGLIEYK